MVDMVFINTNDPGRTNYSINLFRGKTIIVTKLFLKSSKVPAIGSIPISAEDYINESKNFTQETFYDIIFPEVLSPLQHELKYWHDKLYQLHPKSMFRIAKLGVLISIFLELKDYVPLC